MSVPDVASPSGLSAGLGSLSSDSIASTSSSYLGGKSDRNRLPFFKILPVLFYESLAISLTRSLIPRMIVAEFGPYSYFAVGIMETLKGLLAFIFCPIWGRVSDRIGRRLCLLVTVAGSTAPVCVLAFTSNMYIYCVVCALSGVFSATFPLTFAYISGLLR